MAFGKPPSEGHHTSLNIFEEYPAQFSRLSDAERSGIRKTARALFKTSPADALSYLSSQRGYANFRPDALIGKLMRSPVDYEQFRSIGTAAFGDLLNRQMGENEWQQATAYAKAMGIRDPGAFESMLNRRIASTSEGRDTILDEEDLALQRYWGPMARDASGRKTYKFGGDANIDYSMTNKVV
jgi:hypothetical protein